MKRISIVIIRLFLISWFCIYCANATPATDGQNIKLTTASTNDSLLILKSLLKSSASYNPDSCIFYSKLAIDIATRSNDSLSLAELSNYLGNAYFNVAHYDKALEYSYNALKIYQQLNNEIGLAKTLNNIGLIYEIVGDFDQAEQKFILALEIWEKVKAKLPDDVEIKKIHPHIYNNIGILYSNHNQQDKAMKYYDKALILSEESNDKNIKSLILLNIGLVFSKEEKYYEALAFLLKSRGIIAGLNSKDKIANIDNNIGDIYLKLKNYNTAKKYFLSGLTLAKEINANELLKNAYEGLYEVNKEVGNHKEALEYQTLFIELKDSIYSLQSKTRIADLEHGFNMEMKESEIKLLQSERKLLQVHLKSGRTIQLILIGGMIILIFVVIIISFQTSQKRRAYRQLVKKNVEIANHEDSFIPPLKPEQETTDIFSEEIFKKKYLNSSLSEEKKLELSQIIKSIMEGDKPYLNTDFTLANLANRSGVGKSYVSQIINEKFDKNFNAWVNEYRIKEARKMITDPANRNLTIEGIANSVGFSSKSSFNAAFRLYTGVTPSFYFKSVK